MVFTTQKSTDTTIKGIAIQFIKFGVVGISNTLINLAVYYLCVYLFLMHYQLANLLGFLVSVINAYFWNSRYVFKVGRQKWAQHVKTYLKTVAAYGGTYLLSIGLLFVWINLLSISEAIAPLLNVIITTPLNFLVNKLWSFRKEQKPDDLHDKLIS